MHPTLSCALALGLLRGGPAPASRLAGAPARALDALGSQLAPVSRRDVARLAVLAAIPALASERADAGTNPANSYYFPQAKYRYLPRINRASTSLDSAPTLLGSTDWDALESKVWFYSDDAATALTLYANSVEGSRSSKGKKKSARQKQLYVYATDYTKAIERLGKAIKRRNALDVEQAVADGRKALTAYQELADITGVNALPPDVPVDQQKYIAVFKGGGYKNEGKVIIPLR